MMNKFKLLLSIVCLINVMIANGQANTTPVKGTPYLDESYVAGVIHYADKSVSVPVRYNAFQDLIEYQQNGKALVLDPTALITKVELGNSVFVPQKHESKLGYYAVLDSGKMMLFSRKKIKFVPARVGGNLDGSNQEAAYQPAPDMFYYKVGDGPLLEVSNVKSMISSLPDKQEEITKFAKQEKISLKKEKDVLKLVKYYNSL